MNIRKIITATTLAAAATIAVPACGGTEEAPQQGQEAPVAPAAPSDTATTDAEYVDTLRDAGVVPALWGSDQAALDEGRGLCDDVRQGYGWEQIKALLQVANITEDQATVTVDAVQDRFCPDLG